MTSMISKAFNAVFSGDPSESPAVPQDKPEVFNPFDQLAAVDTVPRSTAGVELVLMNIGGQTPLLNAAGGPMGLILLGPDSPAYRRAIHTQTLARIQATEAAVSAGLPPPPADTEYAIASTVEVLCACTVGTFGFLAPDGSPLDLSTDQIRAMYNRFPVVREQAEAFVIRRSNFLSAQSAR